MSNTRNHPQSDDHTASIAPDSNTSDAIQTNQIKPLQASIHDLDRNLCRYEIFNKNEDADTRMMAALSKSDRTMHQFFKPELDKRKAEKLKALLEHVLHGDRVKAKKIYDAYPALLFIESTAEDYAAGIGEHGETIHRIIVASPFRAAVGAEHKEMLAEMKECFDNYVDSNGKTGCQIAAEQMKLQLPNGVKNPPSTYDFSALVTAITNDSILKRATDFIKPGQASPATEVALAKLRKDFMPGVVKVGKHFNMNDLINACEVYDQNWQPWNKYQPWNIYQLSVFWCQVVGYLERLVSARTAMLLAQGLASYVDGVSQLQDTFKLTNYVTKQQISYFPLDTDSSCRLGGGFAVDVDPGLATGPTVDIRAEFAFFVDLCREDATSLGEFKRRLEQPTNQHHHQQAINQRRQSGSSGCVIA